MNVKWSHHIAVGIAALCWVAPVQAAGSQGQRGSQGQVEKRMQQKWLSEHSGAPFSFTYNGASSESLLPQWRQKTSRSALDANRTQLSRTWTEPKTGLVVRCDAIEYHDYPAVEWVLHFTNTSKQDTPIIENIQALDAKLPGSPQGFILHRALGESNSAQSFAPVDDTILPTDTQARVFAPNEGRSSDGNMPYYNVDWHTGGVAVAIGWAGQWAAGFQPMPGGALRVRAGQQLTHFLLHPGETVRTPRIALVFWDGGSPVRGSNLFRQLMMAHDYPRRNGQTVFAPICGTVGYAAPDGSYEKPHLDAIQALSQTGVEVFWSDMDPQQWYPGGFPNGTGTWDVDLAKYPHGLKPVGDAVRAAGMKYLLWFEPERVHFGSKIDKEHPEWVMKPQGEWSQLFRLGDPVARKWLTDYIDVQITAAHVSWLRWDFNIGPLGFWHRNDAPDRQGITEIQHIEGLYAMWEELQRRHPGLLIDICASGGRRLDMETLRYGIPLWHSDLQVSSDSPGFVAANQLQNGGLFPWLPMHGCGDFGLEPSYSFRSGMTSGNIFAVYDPQKWNAATPETEAGVKRSVAIYRKLRPYMLGDFYELFPHDASEKVWYGYQFHRPSTKDGYALLFRRERCADAQQTVHLQGIDPGALYEVSYEDAPGKRLVRGDALRAYPVEVSAKPGSAILYYRKKGL